MIEEQLIRERAHHIWESEGRPSDRADAHWTQAHTQLAAETGRPARGTRKSAALSAPETKVSVKTAPARKPRKSLQPA